MEIEVAIPSPLTQTFTYSHPDTLLAGVRVKVPFAFQGKTIGVVLGSKPDQPPDSRPYKLKAISEVVDLEPAYSPAMIELARWLSAYYMHPIGEVLKAMLPAGKTKTAKTTLTLVSSPDSDHAESTVPTPGRFFARKSQISLATLKLKLKHAGMNAEDIARVLKHWQTSGWVVSEKATDVRARSSASTDKLLPPQDEAVAFRVLNEFQKAAVDTIIAEGIHATPTKPFLVFGVTGSGKTEVFLSVLKELLGKDSDSQALILVPEISLTPQMTKIFQERFPGLVSVVHSAMEDDERWSELGRIRSNSARVLIGPRSAVFGPFRKLKLIIVDEEHDGSYKQGSGLLYNARDVAVMRGRIEDAAVVLGSATPSMESWHNALVGRYQRLDLPERVSKRPLPEVKTILAKPSFKAMNVVRSDDLTAASEENPFAPEIITALQENFAQGNQSIVLVNRRGYAYYLYNLNDRKAAQCPQCSISLSVHGKRKTLRCHYCDYQTTVQKIIADSPTSTWAVVGYGSQKAEEALRAAVPDARIARLDSDTVTDPSAMPTILKKFRERELDILVGTQILAKGHDFPNVTLICILEVDQLLGLPDFRGGERTFQLLVQASGRAGRGELKGHVLVQSMRAEHPIVQEALKQNFSNFAAGELKFREEMGYPPYGRMTLFEFNGPDAAKLNQWCRDLEDQLDQMLQKHPQLIPLVRILGPAPAPIEVIRGRTRRTIIVLSGSHQVTRQVSTWLWQAAQNPPGDIRVKVDVDPQATL